MITWQELVLHSAVEAAQNDRLMAEGWNCFDDCILALCVGISASSVFCFSQNWGEIKIWKQQTEVKV